MRASPVIPHIATHQHQESEISVDPNMELEPAGGLSITSSNAVMSAADAYAAAQDIVSGARNLETERTAGAQRNKVPRNRAFNGGSNKRRPWTKEEENALMKGLDQVQGPKWSQILEMYGPGGKISEVLKDRNQVQLKDKARNLKLFFLKSGLEVPFYLSFVTGELKNRKKGGRQEDS